jgi:hypothetical protein
MSVRRSHLYMPLATFAALALCLFAGLTSARAAAGQARHHVKIAFTLDPAFKVSPQSTTIHVKVMQSGCGPVYERALIHRSPRRLTITLLSAPWSPPGKGTVCPDYIAIRPIALPIGRPLGERAIYDGTYSPPREIYPG